ncbi:hypothetical protein ES703_93662 [subsurface metagenome]
MAQRRASKKEPQIVEMPSQKMAVVYGKGAPDKVFPELMPALLPRLLISAPLLAL